MIRIKGMPSRPLRQVIIRNADGLIGFRVRWTIAECRDALDQPLKTYFPVYYKNVQNKTISATYTEFFVKQ